MRTRKIFPLLVRRRIRNKKNQVFFDAAVIQERVSFCRSTATFAMGEWIVLLPTMLLLTICQQKTFMFRILPLFRNVFRDINLLFANCDQLGYPFGDFSLRLPQQFYFGLGQHPGF